MARRVAKLKPPTLDDALSTLSAYETYWGTLHSEMETDYAIVNNLQTILVPSGYNATYLGTAAAIIASAADHIAGDHPTIEVPEASNAKSAQDRSEKLEKGLQGAQYKIDTEQTDNIRRTIVVNGLWSGMYASKGPIFLADAWGRIPTTDSYTDQAEYASDLAEYEATKKLNWPILRKAVDPRSVFPDPGTIGKKTVILKERRTAGLVQAQWPSWDRRTKGVGKTGKPLEETYVGEWVEYWDEHFRMYVFDGTLIDTVREHDYAKPPFNIRSAGYGIDTGKPEERFRSIIYPARGLLNQQIAAFNQLDAIMRRSAWPIILQPDGAGLDELSPGKVKDINREDIALIRAFTEFQPQIVQGLMEELAYLEAQIEQATFPNVVKGIRAKGIASGYGQNSLVAEAKVKFGPAVVNLESLEAEFNVDLCHCVQHVIEEPLPIFGKTRTGEVIDATLDPADIRDLRHIVVTVNPKLPTDRANEIAIMQVLRSLGLIDKATAISDYAGYPQPGQMLERIAAEEAMDSPQIKQVIAFAAAMENGYIDYVLKAAGEIATKTGSDPTQITQTLLASFGFGQPPGAGSATGPVPGGQPGNIAAQIGVRPAVPSQSILGQQNKSQPGGSLTGSLTGAVRQAQTPGSPTAVRNAAVPGVSIGG